jgi:hypothetical protein
VRKAIDDCHGNLAAVGRQFDVTRQAVHEFVKSHGLEDVVAEARSQMNLFAEDKLFDLIAAGNITAIIFYLKCRAGYVERTHVTQDGDHRITVEVIRRDD